MLQQFFALILIVGAFDSAFAQFKCENHTLPDGSYCPNDGPIDHVSSSVSDVTIFSYHYYNRTVPELKS